MFGKMKVKDGMRCMVINEPEGYPQADNLIDPGRGRADFVHLFVKSRAEFEEYVDPAIRSCEPGGLLWISYPKRKGRSVYDINRDSMWDLSVVHGIHPVSQIALDEVWSAVRFVPNEPGKVYTRPNR